MGSREEFTPKNVLRVDYHLSGCIAFESESQLMLLYSNNMASQTD